MSITIIGWGSGTPDTYTAAAVSAVQSADVIFGEKRLFQSLPPHHAQIRFVTDPQTIVREAGADNRNCCVIYEGDIGFYSEAQALIDLVIENRIPCALLPGISIVQNFASGIGKSWHDWKFSRFTNGTDVVSEVCESRDVFYMTEGPKGPFDLCKILIGSGLGFLRVWVGENLCSQGEMFSTYTVLEVYEQKRTFSPLNVVLVEAAPIYMKRCPGIPDGLFLKDGVSMPRQEVRAVAMAKLAVNEHDVCWDLGSGNGSMAIEMAMQGKEVWAVEADPECCKLILQNRERLGSWKLHLLEEKIPEALLYLPVPDAVYINDQDYDLLKIVIHILNRNENARICISVNSEEKVEAAEAVLGHFFREAETSAISTVRRNMSAISGEANEYETNYLILGIKG